jgi:hypothetical protein
MRIQSFRKIPPGKRRSRRRGEANDGVHFCTDGDFTGSRAAAEIKVWIGAAYRVYHAESGPTIAIPFIFCVSPAPNWSKHKEAQGVIRPSR